MTTNLLNLTRPRALFAGVLVALAGTVPMAHAAISFSQAGANEFAFDTGILRGKLRADGKSSGLSSVVHLPSGTRLDRSMGLFSHYRVFSANKRYGTATWDWPSEARLTDGDVEVRWPAAAERPFELRALYHWSGPNTLDLTTSIEAKADLKGFESFLASYFAESFTNALAYVAEAPEARGGKGFMAAEKSLGTWLAFPRDDAAVALIRDGRWKFEPNPVDWVILPRLAAPVGVRCCPATGLKAVLMSPSTDAFALLMPEQLEGHTSMYFSLFGRDFKAGEKASARARMVVGTGMTGEQTANLYSDYLKLNRK
jgi:hypothetical protein